MAPNIASRRPHCVQQSSQDELAFAVGAAFQQKRKEGLVSSLVTGLRESFSQMRKSRSTSRDHRISAS